MSVTGTKLVVILASLAVLAAVVSWWYRFESAHRATEFWGTSAAQLIAQRADVELCQLQLARQQLTDASLGTKVQLGQHTYLVEPMKTLTDARGMVHLRHSLLSDVNYLWDEPVAVDTTVWRWCLRFHQGEQAVQVLFAEDFSAVARSDDAREVQAVSIEPMAESLRTYFGDLSSWVASNAGE